MERMHRLKTLGLLLFILFATRLCFAAPIYGPNMPDKGKWDAGSQINIVFERDMEEQNGELESEQYFLTLSYGFWEWFCFDGKIGAGNVRRENTGSINYNTNFAGAYGLRAKVYDNDANGVRGILGFQHISVHPDPRNVEGIKHEVIWDDWQFSLLVSKDYKRITPYLGTRVSRVYCIRKINKERSRIRSSDEWGVITGFDFLINDRTRFNLEGRFIDGLAMSTGVTCKF